MNCFPVRSAQKGDMLFNPKGSHTPILLKGMEVVAKTSSTIIPLHKSIVGLKQSLGGEVVAHLHDEGGEIVTNRGSIPVEVDDGMYVLLADHDDVRESKVINHTDDSMKSENLLPVKEPPCDTTFASLHRNSDLRECIDKDDVIAAMDAIHAISHLSLGKIQQQIRSGEIVLPQHGDFEKRMLAIKIIRCDACDIARGTKEHPQDEDRNYDHDLDVWSADQSGPVPQPTFRGEHWMGVVVSPKGMIFVHFNKKKSQTHASFRRHQRNWEAKARQLMKALWSDRGTEYTMEDFEQLLEERGIVHVVGARDSSSGKAENAIRWVSEKGLTFMIASNAPANLWCEAYAAAADHINMQPSVAKDHDGKSHYEMATGMPPPLHKIHPFGCLALVHIPKAMRRKNGRRFEKLIHLRRSENGPGFRFYNPRTTRIIHAKCRPRYFREKVFPWRKDKSNESLNDYGFLDFDPLTQTAADDYEENAAFTNLVPGSNVKTSVSDPSVSGGDNESSKLGQPGEIVLPQPSDQSSEPSENYDPHLVMRQALGGGDEIGADNPLEEGLDGPDGEEYVPAMQVEPRPIRIRKRPAVYAPEDKREVWQSITAEQMAADSVRMVNMIATRVQPNGLWLRKDVLLPPEGPRQIEWSETTRQRSEWRKAVKREIGKFISLDAFNVVSRSKTKARGKIIIGHKFILSVKGQSSDRYVKETDFKARFVGKGFQQDRTTVGETFAPTPALTSGRLVAITALQNKWRCEVADVETAFLIPRFVTSEEYVYIEAPKGYYDDPDLIWEMKVPIYGTLNAAAKWAEEAHEHMTTSIVNGSKFVALHSDPCVFKHIDKRGKLDCVVALHVDDFSIAGTPKMRACTKLMIAGVHQDTKKAPWKVKDLGEIRYHLGVEYRWAADRRSFELNQQAYTDEILAEYNMTKCRETAYTPAPEKRLEHPTEIISVEEEYYMKDKKLRSGIQKVAWLARQTRPELHFAVNQVQQHTHDPRRETWQAFLHLLRYLKTTRDHCLRYSLDSTKRVHGYTDSDFAPRESPQRVSTSGYAFLLNGAAICCKSKRQTIVAQSSTQAEFIAMAAGANEAMWIRTFLEELQIEPSDSPPMDMFVDNNSAKAIAEKRMMSERTKAIEVKYYAIREFIRKKLLKVPRVDTADNVADVFTKPLGRVKLTQFRAALGVVPMTIARQ
jgi:hypothetical protein